MFLTTMSFPKDSFIHKIYDSKTETWYSLKTPFKAKAGKIYIVEIDKDNKTPLIYEQQSHWSMYKH